MATCIAVVGLEAAHAAVRRATVQGVDDRTLRADLERVVGEEKRPPANRLDARRRARKAVDGAVAYLRSEGYYDNVVEPDIGDGDTPQPILKITPGPRYKLAPAAVEWSGTAPDAPADAFARKAVDIRPGDPGRAADVIGAEGRIIAALTQRGYADARAEPREVIVDHADLTVRPTYRIAAGPLVKLDGLAIKSLGRTRERWLRGLAPWKTGDVYRPDKVAELERRLLDTQVYDQVTVALSPSANPDGLRPVVVSLADRPRKTLEFSAGYATTEGADFDVRLNDYNRFGRGDTLSYEARLATIDSRLGVDLTLPHWRRPGQTLKPSAQLFRTDTDAYAETGVQASVDLTRRFGKTSYFTRGVSITQSQVEDKHEGTINITALRFLGAYLLDRADNALNPRRGWKLEVRGQPTGIAGDEQLLYIKAVAQGSAYFPLDRRGDTVIAVRARVGSILGGNIPQVPASDRFYAGGGGSVRGYGYQSVGPHYSDNKPIGGLALFETSFELRRKIRGAIGGVLFLDTGSISTGEVPDFGHTFSGIGVGLRYDLGFAPIRIDVATPLQQPGGDKQAPIQVYLSIGQSF